MRIGRILDDLRATELAKVTAQEPRLRGRRLVSNARSARPPGMAPHQRARRLLDGHHLRRPHQALSRASGGGLESAGATPHYSFARAGGSGSRRARLQSVHQSLGFRCGIANRIQVHRVLHHRAGAHLGLQPGRNYLIKQICLSREKNAVRLAYHWLPDADSPPGKATLKLSILAGFRHFHNQIAGSAGNAYAQQVGENSSTIILDSSSHRLHLSWSDGSYEGQSQWWWGYHWPEEMRRGLPDQEDLLLVGIASATLEPSREFCLSACLDHEACETLSQRPIDESLSRQSHLLSTANLPRSPETDLLVLACDQFLVPRSVAGQAGLSVMAGYPWFVDAGRAAMIALPGLTLATRRFAEAKEILSTFSRLVVSGVMPNRYSDASGEPDYSAADTTLWWAWALYHYYRASKDRRLIEEQLPMLRRAAEHYIEGTTAGITMDSADGLIRLSSTSREHTWMDMAVAGIPITPRAGKPVEICALWYNLLETLCYFCGELGEDAGQFRELSALTQKSMQKFWNNDRQCLFDVIEPQYRASREPDDSVRPNQLFAVSLPFRAFSAMQEKAILTLIDQELLTPVGLRSLSPTDPSYQGRYGCGFSRADQYHRGLSCHQGCVFPWLLGPYCDALMNVHGPLPETQAKVRILLQPLLNHLMNEACLGSISEIFDGDSPHAPQGCVADAMAVGETMRVLARVLRP